MARPKGMDFSAYTAPSFQFWYEEKWYTVQGAETMINIGTKDDMSTMRSEYTRMRDVAQKRIARLQKMYPDSVGARHRYDTGKKDKEGNPIYKSGFPTLKSLNPKDFAKAFADLAKFLRAKGSTATGQRQIKEKTMKTWQDQGLPVNEGNYNMVIKVLEEARKNKAVYGSDAMVEYAEMILERPTLEQEMWLAHLDDLLPRMDEIRQIPVLWGYDFDEILELLGD